MLKKYKYRKEPGSQHSKSRIILNISDVCRRRLFLCDVSFLDVIQRDFNITELIAEHINYGNFVCSAK